MEVTIPAVRSVTIAWVAVDSLVCPTDHGSGGSLRLQHDTDDHASVVGGTTLALATVALWVSILESMSLLVFRMVTLRSLPSSCSILNLSISQRASPSLVSKPFFSIWSASHSSDTQLTCCCFSCSSLSHTSLCTCVLSSATLD